MNEREKAAIIQEVLRLLRDAGWDQAREQGRKQNIDQSLMVAKPGRLVLIDMPADDELAKLRRQYGSQYELQVWQAGELAERMGPELLNKPGEVFLLGLSLKSVAELALGLRQTSLTELVAQMLVHGFTFRVFSGEGLPVGCPPAYREMIERYLFCLHSFGFSFGEGHSMLKPGANPKIQSPGRIKAESMQADNCEAERQPSHVFKGKLLTARNIREIANKTIIKVAPGTVITALARDEAKDRSMEICEVNPSVFG